MMIPSVPSLQTSAKELSTSAKETTEEMRKALRNLYSTALNCSDLSVIESITLPNNCHDGSWKDGCDHDGSSRDVEGAVTLDWRSDPIVSLSDLTLVVYDGSGGVPYHVHTLLLAFGGRRSGFVVEQLKQQQRRSGGSGGNSINYSKNNNKKVQEKDYKIEIYVPPLAARCIPTFLDYIYGAVLDLTTSNALPLRYLSNRFDVRDLHTHITQTFLPQDLELNTAPQYCIAADELKDFELREKALRIMAERIDRINPNTLKNMSPRLMISLVQCDKLECKDAVLSEKVASWLRCRNEGLSDQANSSTNGKRSESDFIPLTDEDFYWITHIQSMPQISQHEALFYLNYATNFPQVMNEVGPGSLKTRCLTACAGDWALDFLTNHLSDPVSVPLHLYENLDMAVKVQLLEASLVAAKKIIVERECQSSVRELRDQDIYLSNELTHEYIQEQSPSAKLLKVVVLGCGIPSANGLYICNATTKAQQDSQNVTIYEKEAIWKQSRVTFLLFPTKSGQYYSQYKLAVRQNNQTKILYNSPNVVGMSCADLPEQGWEAQDDGINPPPLFVGRVAESSTDMSTKNHA